MSSVALGRLKSNPYQTSDAIKPKITQIHRTFYVLLSTMNYNHQLKLVGDEK